MYSKGVLVQVKHPLYGSVKGSGLLINNVVIAHGSLLLPLCLLKNSCKDVKNNYNSFLKELESSRHLFGKSNQGEKTEAHSFKFNIYHKVRSPVSPNTHNRNWTSCGFAQDLQNRSANEEIFIENATMCLIHHYGQFSGLMENISNWTLSNKENEIDDERSLYSVVLPTFFFLMIGEPCKDLFENTMQAFFKKSQDINLYPGMPIVIESTPFGNFSFMNSWSCGIISKTVGYKNDGFLTDSRLVYGCEGAPVFE